MSEQAGTVRVPDGADAPPISPGLDVRAIQVPSALVLTGELDIAGVERFREAIAPSLGHGGTVILDLTNLAFMDSSGIHVLLDAAKRLDGKGCLFLHGVHEPVTRLFELVGISGFENIHVIGCDVDPFLIQA